MTEHNIEIPCNTEVVIRVSCKEVTVEPILITDLLPLDPTSDPVFEAISVMEQVLPVTIELEPIPVVELLPAAPDRTLLLRSRFSLDAFSTS